MPEQGQQVFIYNTRTDVHYLVLKAVCMCDPFVLLQQGTCLEQ